MEDLKLSEEQLFAYSLIELRILFQRAIEIMDVVNRMDHKSKNKALNSQLKAIYPALDKETKKFNEIYEVDGEGVSHFYDIVVKNSQYIMGYGLLDKALICSFLVSHEMDPKAVEGIINKTIKRNSLKK
jgi:hypothetical protein